MNGIQEGNKRAMKRKTSYEMNIILGGLKTEKNNKKEFE